MLANNETNNFAVEELLRADAFPHEVSQLQLLETHISWIILTGPYAYKIKKPVKFDFVDYSSPQLRKEFCEKELLLNRRFAPDLYLDVVPIFEIDGRLIIGDGKVQQMKTGEPIEFAVKMREFPQDSMVAARLRDPKLTTLAIEEFGIYVAKFHDSIESAIPTIECVQPERIAIDALDNFVTLRELADAEPGNERAKTLEKLEVWTAEQLQKLPTAFQHRLESGNVRRCHGDLHLKNIIQIDGRLTAFDGIEFNEEFQWVDVLSEIAFPVMDFVARGRADLGWRLLNIYLEKSGDYDHLDVLRFYLVYRAMVRAKVTWLNPKNHAKDDARTTSSDDSTPSDDLTTQEIRNPWDKYINAASYFAFDVNPSLAITFGFSGSGKSTVAMKSIEQNGGVRIRSDVERTRLVQKFKWHDKYSSEMSEWVYNYLLKMASSSIRSGFPVVVDATFLKQKQRNRFHQLARDLNVEFQILNCDAPFDELCRRIRERHSDASEATIEVLKNQMETHEPLTTDELQFVRHACQA